MKKKKSWKTSNLRGVSHAVCAIRTTACKSEKLFIMRGYLKLSFSRRLCTIINLLNNRFLSPANAQERVEASDLPNGSKHGNVSKLINFKFQSPHSKI